MLCYVQPDLQDIAHRYAVVSNGASKYAFAVSRNANIDVRLFLAAVPGKSEVSHNVRAQALKIKIRFHAVNKADGFRL